MSNVLKTIVEGEIVYIEVEASYGSEETTSASEVLEKAKDAFQQARTTITSVTKSMISGIRAMDQATIPDEFGLEFAIKFDAEGNAIVAKAALEASLKVSMVYKSKKDN